MNWRLFLSALGMVFLSEMGDKTQVTTMLLAGAKPQYVFYVALGSTMALLTTSFIEVMVGSNFIAKFLKASALKIISGLVFSIIGLLLILGLLGSDV